MIVPDWTFETEVIYTEDKMSKMGIDKTEVCPITIFLPDVNAVMPGDDEENTTIIFIQGTSIEIKEKCKKFTEVWKDYKAKYNYYMSPKRLLHE